MAKKKKRKKKKSRDINTRDALAFANSAVALSIGTHTLRHI